MAVQRFTIALEGKPDDGGDVSLSDFIEKLTAFKGALRQAEKIELRNTDVSTAVDYRIVDLHHSTATAVIEARPKSPVYTDFPRRIGRRLAISVRLVQRKRHFNEQNIDLFNAIGKVAGHSDVSTVERVRLAIHDQPEVGAINREVARHIESITKVAEEGERDSIVGRLEQVDIHDKNRFVIFPIAGATRIICNFPAEKQDKVSENIGKYVEVDGFAIYRAKSKFPYMMKVVDFEPLPDLKSLPKLSELHGIAPDATDGLTASEFIRQMRDGSW